MKMTAPRFPQIKAQVAAIRQKIPDARVIGIRSAGRWTGERRREDGDELYMIEQCDSPLAMRIALREEGDGKVIRVLVTRLENKDLSADILVRLAKCQLFPIDSWQIVKSLFQARAIDPRIIRHRWIAERLLEFIPEDGYAPAPGGFLDAENIWPILLDRSIGLATPRPELLELLRWSIDPENVRRFREESTEFRDAATAWLAELAGPTAKTVLGCVAVNERADALPIGLAAGVVFHPDNAGRLDKAAGRMEERYFGGVTPDDRAIDQWVAAATEVVRSQLIEPKLKESQLQRADGILHEVGAHSFAFLSDTSPLGFDQRLTKFGERLGDALASEGLRTLEPMAEARRLIGEHELAARARRRLERVDMALRLVRWLSGFGDAATHSPRSLGEAVKAHLAEGGFVDWARLSLRTGDPLSKLSEAYAKLSERVAQVREEQSNAFASLLKDWTSSGSSSGSIVPVESILETVVAPLAAERPILLIVIDGMSVAVARELVADITRDVWIALCGQDEALALMGGVAAIPSVTRVSRTSLLCGRLLRGESNDEQDGFESHPALLDRCRSDYPPILFHKRSLQEENDSGLASEIRREIASTDRRIVGVVVNAVDDHLLKGDQIDTSWTRDTISVLPPLLHEAQSSERLVILASDHGHVLDVRTNQRKADGGERWRYAEGEPLDGEITLSGLRVVDPKSKTLVALWTEGVRYGAKKNGYHGGASPQEMVAPIAVLCSTTSFPEGWKEASVDTPVWWEELMGGTTEERKTPTDPNPIGSHRFTKTNQTGYLFDMKEQEGPPKDSAASVEHPPQAPQWISDLLASSIYLEQKKLAGRSAPSDEVLGRFLGVLDARGDKMTSAALSRALNFSPGRLPGLLAVVQRVINVDGFPVITRDETSETVELNRELLRRQFELERCWR